MTAIPQEPDTLLSRIKTAAALTAAGYPISAATLATKASRGGGPRYSRFGARALYRWGDALAWARANTIASLRNCTALHGMTEQLNTHRAEDTNA